MANNNKHTGPNVPALRFPEFSEEWERKALSEFVDRVTRRNKGLKSTRPLTISAEFGLVDQTEFFKKSVAGADLSNYYLLSKGEFAYNKSYSDGYPLGAIKRLDRYDSGVLSSLYICYVPKPFMSSDYLVQYFESTKWNQVVKDISGEGARNHGLLNVPVTGFFETQHYIPKRDEQEKLGAFLTLIEKRIATQSKIIEELTTLRSALIEKCAKQSGNFFSLSDILKEAEERSTTANQYQVLSSTVKGIFSQKEYFNKDIASDDNKGYKVVRKGHIVLSPQNLWMGNINYNDRFDIGIVSPSYKVFSIKDGFNPIFIAALLQTKKALNEYMLASEQGASIVRRNLNIEAFMAIKFRIPDARQQDSLSMAITAINAKLNNEQCYLEQLTMQKSCLLENMFI